MKHLKHAILWSMPSMPFYEASQACHLMKHAKHVSTPESDRAFEHDKYVKHAS